MTNGGTKANVDDDFDLLSSRVTTESPAKADVTDNLDLLGTTSSSDPWNLDNMNKSLPSEQQQQ